MAKICNKCEKAITILCIVLLIIVLIASISFLINPGTFNYVIILSGVILSALIRVIVASVPTK